MKILSVNLRKEVKLGGCARGGFSQTPILLLGVLMGTGKFAAGGNLVMDKHPIQGGVKILLVTSCYGNWDKLWPDGPLGSYADLTYLLKGYVCGGEGGRGRSRSHFIKK